MNNNKIFCDDFRVKTFNELKSLGNSINSNLISIFQNPVPISDSDLEFFNTSTDYIIQKLNELRDKVNDEIKSDRLIPFNKSNYSSY